ncbi:hypothetical protein F5I97DRAFT_402411 [Phlebopus sp. FC_14]|nr:hypothetical protein F5I97DRAFT_402411 [Phlebopus sp. FC_14]
MELNDPGFRSEMVRGKSNHLLRYKRNRLSAINFAGVRREKGPRLPCPPRMMGLACFWHHETLNQIWDDGHCLSKQKRCPSVSSQVHFVTGILLSIYQHLSPGSHDLSNLVLFVLKDGLSVASTGSTRDLLADLVLVLGHSRPVPLGLYQGCGCQVLP